VRDRFAAVQRVVLVTLVLNLSVAIAKITYGYLSNAISIRADGFHSLTDGINNVAGLVGLWFARQPPDEKHPYGHHKHEVVVALAVGVSLLVMAYDVVRSSIERFMGSGDGLPRIDVYGYLVLGLTLVVNLFVAAYESRKGKELNSAFLTTDALHTRSDVAVTSAVLGAAVLVRHGYAIFDVLAAAAVAVFIAIAGWNVVRQNLNYLADSSLVARDEVNRMVLEVPGVAGAHKIRTRGLPGAIYMDLHIQIAAHLDVVQAHEVTHWVIDAIKTGCDGVVDVTVHTEPAQEGLPYRALPWEE